MEIILGIAALLAALGLFSVFSFKAPNGSAAMSGLADAAIATFLVEAIHKYVMGNLLGIEYLADFGNMVGGDGRRRSCNVSDAANGCTTRICDRHRFSNG